MTMTRVLKKHRQKKITIATSPKENDNSNITEENDNSFGHRLYFLGTEI